MTVAELRSRMSTDEEMRWGVFYELEAEEMERANKGVPRRGRRR